MLCRILQALSGGIRYSFCIITDKSGKSAFTEKKHQPGTKTIMARIRICPNINCQTENPATATECEACGCDLTNVKPTLKQETPPEAAVSPEVTSAEKEAVPRKPAASASENTPFSAADASPAAHNSEAGNDDGTEFVKICPECGQKNRGVAKICTKCKASLKSIRGVHLPKDAPAAAPSARPEPRRVMAVPEIRLMSSDGQEIFRVTESNPVFSIGREQVLSGFLRNCDYVSRRHAEISLIQSTLSIMDLNSTNGTFVNDCKLEQGRRRPLENGDRVSLGGFWGTEKTGCFTVEYRR